MCNCVAKVNVNLAKYNTVLETTLFSFWALVRTGKVDRKKRGKPSTVAASYCPFCGNKYPSKKSDLAPIGRQS